MIKPRINKRSNDIQLDSGMVGRGLQLNVLTGGQVFTPQHIVDQMVRLKKNNGTVLEPSAGDGIFVKEFKNCIGIEIDSNLQNPRVKNIDFFDYSTEHKFETIIGNPPYVRFRDIVKSTKSKLPLELFDRRTNLYLFFINKCIDHLTDNGELIFITPRDFIKSTNAINLNKKIYREGTITDFIDLGDTRIFPGFDPNCAIWRFEKGNKKRKTNTGENFILESGNIVFTKKHYAVKLSDLFLVKVGAVSGDDEIFVNEKFGNKDFLYSKTKSTGKTRRMIFNKKVDYLNQFKERLISRKIKPFNESNWYEWGRAHHIADGHRIYVNTKTRDKEPFFVSDIVDYDGSVLALFPKSKLPLDKICKMLNRVDWNDKGFVCDGRFIFSQRSLENTLLPIDFKHFSKPQGNLL